MIDLNGVGANLYPDAFPFYNKLYFDNRNSRWYNARIFYTHRKFILVWRFYSDFKYTGVEKGLYGRTLGRFIENEDVGEVSNFAMPFIALRIGYYHKIGGAVFYKGSTFNSMVAMPLKKRLNTTFFESFLERVDGGSIPFSIYRVEVQFHYLVLPITRWVKLKKGG